VFDQAVKRNLDRFPPDFMFRLTEEEFQNLRSQFATSKPGRGIAIHHAGGRIYYVARLARTGCCYAEPGTLLAGERRHYVDCMFRLGVVSVGPT